MSWSHTNMKLFHTNSTKNVIKSLNHGYYMQILPKASWNLEIMTLFHKNYTKNVMKSQNHEVIPYKFYQKFLEISQSWHYSIQILSKMSWNLKIKILFHTNSTKNVMKCHEITQLWRYSIQILPKNVMKSQNHDVIPYKLYQKCHEV